jgi:hypothetical protein
MHTQTFNISQDAKFLMAGLKLKFGGVKNLLDVLM